MRVYQFHLSLKPKHLEKYILNKINLQNYQQVSLENIILYSKVKHLHSMLSTPQKIFSIYDLDLLIENLEFLSKAFEKFDKIEYSLEIDNLLETSLCKIKRVKFDEMAVIQWSSDDKKSEKSENFEKFEKSENYRKSRKSRKSKNSSQKIEPENSTSSSSHSSLDSTLCQSDDTISLASAINSQVSSSVAPSKLALSDSQTVVESAEFNAYGPEHDTPESDLDTIREQYAFSNREESSQEYYKVDEMTEDELMNYHDSDDSNAFDRVQEDTRKLVSEYVKKHVWDTDFGISSCRWQSV